DCQKIRDGVSAATRRLVGTSRRARRSWCHQSTYLSARELSVLDFLRHWAFVIRHSHGNASWGFLGVGISFGERPEQRLHLFFHLGRGGESLANLFRINSRRVAGSQSGTIR